MPARREGSRERRPANRRVVDRAHEYATGSNEYATLSVETGELFPELGGRRLKRPAATTLGVAIGKLDADVTV